MLHLLFDKVRGMSTRPLRTTPELNPRTQGGRIRAARLSVPLSQAQLAAQVKHFTKSNITKSLVSQWERDAVANPQNENMLAIAAITSHSVEWLVNGKGDRRPRTMAAAQASAPPLDMKRLQKSLALVMPNLQPSAVKAVATVYDMLGEDASLSDAVLKHVVAGFTQS